MYPRGSVIRLSMVRALARLRPHSLKQVLLRHAPVLALVSLPLTAQAVFTTPGSFEVNPDGSAGYTIPIQVPPGTAGMAPKLSLSYNSNGGNGVLGMGWNLEGLSQIGRCPKTMAIDGTRGGINLDANDRYCIDGQRLLSTGGTYGADGTEYRTELANFAKVVSYGTAGTGPAWFKVWTKGGQIIEYGNTADSRIEAQGKPTALSWGVNKISDTKGNYLTVSYTEDNANGETLVNRIDYTGNPSTTPTLAPYASVQITYETRPDPSIAYLAGSVIKSTKRMTNVKTYSGTTLVKDYRFGYEQSIATNRSRLKRLMECNESNICLQETNFAWEDFTEPGLFNIWTQGNTGAGTDTSYAHYFADVNGDGLPDLIAIGRTSSVAYVGLNTGNGNFQVWTQSISGVGTDDNYAHYFEDVNGDGLPDLIAVSRASSVAYVGLNAGNGNFQIWTQSISGVGTDNNYAHYFEDVSGDGLPDLIAINRASSAAHVGLNTGNGNFQIWTQSNIDAGADNNYVHSFADVNGDGLPDLIVVSRASSAAYVGLNIGGGNFQIWTQSNIDAGADNNYVHSFADVNGDGLADLIAVSRASSVAYVGLSTGNGNFQIWTQSISGVGTDNNYAHYFEDVNGDRLSDLIAINRTSSAAYVGLNTGNGNFQIWTQGSMGAGAGANYVHYFADVNGDGLPDLIAVSRASSVAYVGFANGKVPDILTTITTGLGAATSVAYKPLSDSAVYTKDTGTQSAVYPVQDLQSPMYVVSSVSMSDGLGGSVVTNYTYGGAKVDLNGRGFLGFRWTKAVSPDINLDLTTYYRQDYPYIGLPSQSEKRTTSGALLSTVANTYANTVLTSGSATSQFPYVSQTQELNYELNGSLVTSTTTGYQYDIYGNATQVTVNSNDGLVKTTANLYANDVPNWLLGRLLRSIVTTTAP